MVSDTQITGVKPAGLAVKSGPRARRLNICTYLHQKEIIVLSNLPALYLHGSMGLPMPWLEPRGMHLGASKPNYFSLFACHDSNTKANANAK